MDKIVLEAELKTFRGWIWSKIFYIPGAGAGTTAMQQRWFHFQLLRTWPPAFYLHCFKAGCKLVSLSRMAFHQSMLMSRRLRNLLRMCSTWLKLAQ